MQCSKFRGELVAMTLRPDVEVEKGYKPREEKVIHILCSLGREEKEVVEIVFIGNIVTYSAAYWIANPPVDVLPPYMRIVLGFQTLSGGVGSFRF